MKRVSGLAAWLAASFLMLVAGPALAQATQSNLQVKDAGGNTVATCAMSQGGALFPCHVILIKGSDGSLHFALGDNAGDQFVTVVGPVPLPTNAVQETGGHVANIDTSTSAAATSAAATATNTGNTASSAASIVTNTAAGAKESGGHLATIDTSTSAAATSAATAATNTGNTATGLGAPGSTVCGTDTGSCNLNAQIQRALQRFTTLIAALGSPFQAGGNIGNTGFGITGNLPDTSGGSLAAAATNTSATATDIGAPGATVCGTDTGSCNLNAQIQRALQRLTTLISTLGTPLQAGGNVAVTSCSGCGGGSSALSGNVTNPSSTLTLPATTTQYAANTLLCTSATVGTCNTALASQSFAIANSGGGASIPRVRLSVNDSTSTGWGNAQMVVDLWTAAPTFQTTGDRGSFDTDFLTGSGGHLASYTCTMSVVRADGAYAECASDNGASAMPKLASGSTIFWTLRTTTGSAGVTGASKVWALIPEIQN